MASMVGLWRSWTEDQLQQFLQAATGHRLYPAFYLSAATGMRRNEILGLQWADVDWKRGTISVNRGLVSVGYERQVTRCKTKNSRRLIELDPTTLALLCAWHIWSAWGRGRLMILRHGCRARAAHRRCRPHGAELDRWQQLQPVFGCVRPAAT